MFATMDSDIDTNYEMKDVSESDLRLLKRFPFSNSSECNLTTSATTFTTKRES